MPLFTVFTPTYNRAHTLPAVYSSLLEQTLRDFEWVIVDDGSTDGTAALVEDWCREGRVNIRYFWQSNGGKHVAFNRGVAEAAGELFLAWDSDDVGVPLTLERLKAEWESIPPTVRAQYSGVTCLCGDKNGNVLGDPFPVEALDSDAIRMNFHHRVRGDKWGFHRTAILREFPFPVFPGERFLAEGVIWNRIGRRYRMRFLNEVLQRKVYLQDGLTTASVRLRAASPEGACLYYSECARLPIPLSQRVRAYVNYWRFSFHRTTPRGLRDYVEEVGWGGLLFVGGGLFLHWYDRATGAKERKSC